jgi:hypothetical protein
MVGSPRSLLDLVGDALQSLKASTTPEEWGELQAAMLDFADRIEARGQQAKRQRRRLN